MRDVGPREAAHSAYSALDSAERPPGPVLAPGKDLCAPASPVRRGACPGGRAGPGATGRKRSHFPLRAVGRGREGTYFCWKPGYLGTPITRSAGLVPFLCPLAVETWAKDSPHGPQDGSLEERQPRASRAQGRGRVGAPGFSLLSSPEFAKTCKLIGKSRVDFSFQ